MTSTTYDVRIWKITQRKNTKGKVTSYAVRWAVAGKPFYESFKNFALADSFRSDLMSAARKGEAFVKASGRPVSMVRTNEDMNWLDFAKEYTAMKWPNASASHRRGIVQSLTSITTALVSQRNAPPQRALHDALSWELNPTRTDPPTEPKMAEATRWLAKSTYHVSALSDPEVVRQITDNIGTKLDGGRVAPDTFRLRRVILDNALDYAVERNLLDANPLDSLKLKTPKRSNAIDKRSVVNPIQARTLLLAVREIQRAGPHLVAFFGLMYHAGLRPEEAAGLKKANLSLPESGGWGELHLERAMPEVGAEWTDAQARGEGRGLKHRDDGTGRTVPCSPELTDLLHEHLNRYGTARDGRLFRGERREGRISSTVYGRVWAHAREKAFVSTVVDSPLAKRPYDLRHACVSMWLNAGVEPPRVAEWAGHSVRVLLEVYAKCLDSGEQLARQRVEQALR
ncbi:integrase [Saccharopolyspora lacisalsi]|uniref:Integrase n=1 Tax=Halosaccharopolyspora lacisalsi TaxID=1000566 RepID=A0A839E015_9PSEU|nr:tyrosine-type recombinase/integrase [Halosaccharopolyspora lacisalsi]MBA8827104.1 integrase [Halosaccharopolyspora lacisalsi]